MIQFILLVSRQGKLRLARFYADYSLKERQRRIREVTAMVMARKPRACNFVEFKDSKICYKRYASLFFIAGVDETENELMVLETLHRYVEALDRYFENVCELDLIFGFHKAQYVLDEFVLKGELQEPSGKAILQALLQADQIEAEEAEERRLF